MKVRNHARRLGHQGRRKRAGESHPVEQGGLVESFHLDDGIGQFAGSIES